MWNRVRNLHASDNIKLPSLYLHAVKCSAWATVLEICASGFQHGAESVPYGIYSVDVGRQAELVKSYDGGAALVFEACAFAVDISPTSASGKAREYPHWIADKWGGAVPGVCMHRRMASGMHEYTHHMS